MVMEALVYILTLLFGVSTVIIIKNKRYKVVPFICCLLYTSDAADE